MFGSNQLIRFSLFSLARYRIQFPAKRDGGGRSAARSREGFRRGPQCGTEQC
jgi:hypothetical protein